MELERRTVGPVLVMALAALALRATPAAAQVRLTPAVAAAEVRVVIGSPLGAPLLQQNPGLELIHRMDLTSSADLKALEPLASHLPYDFPQLPPQAQVAALVSAYAAAIPNAVIRVEAPSRRAATLAAAGALDEQALSKTAEEISPYALYGPRAVSRIEAFSQFAKAARESKERARVMAQVLMHRLNGPASIEDSPAVHAANAWSAYSSMLEGAHVSVLATNPPGGIVAGWLDHASEQGIPVTIRRTPDASRIILVVDNRERADFGFDGRVLDRRTAARGESILADGAVINADAAYARSVREATQAHLNALPPETSAALNDAISSKNLGRAARRLGAATVAALILGHYSLGLLAIPLLLWTGIGVLSKYGSWKERDVLRAAVRRGWHPLAPEAASAAGGAPEWERIMADQTWSPEHPYYKRLDAATASLKERTLPNHEFRRLLTGLSSEAWKPYVRENHLGVVWSHLRAVDPETVAAAAAFLSAANPYFLTTYLEGHPGEQALLSVLREHASGTAATLERELKNRADTLP